MPSKNPPLLDSTASIVAPAVLLPYQQAWVADKSQLKVAEKSRRIGLTWAEAADDVLIAASDKKSGGQNVYYVGYNQDMTMEFIEACAMWARSFDYVASEIEEGLWEDEDKQIKTFTIRFPNSKHRITALSSRPSNLRGKQGVVVIDEAAFHEDLAGLIKAALALLIWGGKVRIISTHNGDENLFNELINEIRSGKRKGSVFRCDFHEAVKDGLYKRVCLRRGIEYDADEETKWVKEVYDFYGDDADEELDVIPSQGSGRWLSTALLEKLADEQSQVVTFTAPKGFDTWTEEARTTEVETWLKATVEPLLVGLQPQDTHFYGLDFARKRDASSMWVQGQRLNLKRYCPFVLEMIKVPYNQQKQILSHVTDCLPRFAKGAHDATGNGGYLAEQMQIKWGERVEAVMLSEGWYREHTPHFKASLEDGMIENMPANKDIRDDHLLFRKVKGVAKIPDQRTKSEDGSNKRHGDSGIAHLLCDYASTMPMATMAWTPAPTASELSGKLKDMFDDWHFCDMEGFC